MMLNYFVMPRTASFEELVARFPGIHTAADILVDIQLWPTLDMVAVGENSTNQD